MELTSPVDSLLKTSKPQIAALKKLGILTVQDLLLHLPYRYLDFSQTKQIRDLKPEENVSLKVTIKNISSRFSFRGRMSLAEAVVSDETGSLKVVWFNQPYLAKSLSSGEEIFLAGQANYYNNGLQMTNPIYEKVSDFPVHTSRLVPLYHLKQNIYPKTFRNLVAQALPLCEKIDEPLPIDVLKSQELLTIGQTIKYSHFPESDQQVEQAKKRLAFEEIFYSQLLAQQHKLKLAQKKSFQIPFDRNLVTDFLPRLPFKLTLAQKAAAWEIFQDLEKPVPMNRLLEGDVGSGKTLVALMAALEAMSMGLQAALLTPTEILAKQHFDTASKFLSEPPVNFNTRCGLLTKNYSQINRKNTDRKKLLNLITQGMPGLYIGTHALLEDKIKFKNLALVVIDEQHRFGVEQRAALMRNSNIVPHLLSLTATPIPRTLQLAYYGELDISQIKQKPVGRKPIITKLIAAENRNGIYKFISDQIVNGRQAFVITPLVEESDKLGVKAATSEVKNLEKFFPQFKIGLMHGRLKGAEKEQVMADFLANKIQILVSTSVVEVGVDVPNASVMVIEGAERFGLAQLHQFRGRVGRAEHQSYCFLFSSKNSPVGNGLDRSLQTQDSEDQTQQRLQAFTKTADGFELAELDLKQRGFGKIYGSEQSGWNFKYFDHTYTDLIKPARGEALKILQKDLDLKNYPKLKDKIKDQVVHFE